MKPLVDKPGRESETANRLETGGAAGLIIAAGLIAYAGSMNGPFVFDDPSSITDNPSIRHLWPIGPVLSPPFLTGQTVGGRPVLNLSLAINYASGGLSVRGYHAVNLAIHLLASLALFGFVRRTLELPSTRLWLGEPRSRRAIWVAWATALLWAVHPLQTESVTYVIQRAESLMGLFYLLTLYAFVRSATSGDKKGGAASHGGRWAVVSCAACLLGMGTKEVMVSAPLVVLLYDRTFLSGGFREAWTKRGLVHAALFSTWILLAILAQGARGRGGTVGAGVAVSWWNYELTQAPAIVHYMRLAVWPNPLIFDYGAEWVSSAWSVLPQALALGVLAAVTLATARRRMAVGFAGAWFLAILAPTSLLPGIRQTIAEHRMYLALAPLLAPVMIGGAAWIARQSSAGRRRTAWIAGGGLVCAVAVLFIGLTRARNETYANEVALWADTIAHRPRNAYAHNDLGVAVRGADVGRAIQQFQEALRLMPDNPEVHNNLGAVLEREGHPADAVEHYREAVRLRPNFAEAYNNLGVALADLGRPDEAIAALKRALELKPDYPEASYNLGLSLGNEGRVAEATAAYAEAIRLNPNLAEARVNLGIAFAREGRLPEALAQFNAAIEIKPDFAEAHFNLGNALVMAGRYDQAAREYAESLRLRPDFAPARENLSRLESQGLAGGEQK